MKRRFMVKIVAVLTVGILLVGLSACDRSEQKTVQLDDGWLIRSDAQGVGESDGWHEGFSEDDADGEVDGDIVWYCNTFRSALSGADRLILTLSDIDEGAKVWLNGRQLEYSGAWGDTRLDVTGIAKKSGKNVLVIRTESGKAWSLSRTALSAASDTAIMDVAVAADGATGVLDVQVQLLEDDAPVQMTVTATDTGKVMARVTADSENRTARLNATVDGVIAWTGREPFLYTLEITAGAEQYSTDIGFTDRGLSERDEFVDGGEPLLVKAAVVPDGVMLDAAQMRTFVNFIRAVGFNTLQTKAGRPTQALLDYCSFTGIYVCGADGQIQPSALDATELPTDRLTVFGEDLQMPEQVAPALLQEWYDQYGLDRYYANAAEAYDMVGAAHVQEIERQLRQLRRTGVSTGFVYAGDLLPYPNTMLDVLSDSVSDLRFCIDAPDVAEAGDRLSFRVSLADFHVLWERDFTATVTVSGPDGVIYEEKVTVTGEYGNRTLTLLSDSVVLTGAAGTYTVAAVFDNYAHPTCAEKAVTVWERGEMPATVYAVDLPEDARTALADWGISVADAVKTAA